MSAKERIYERFLDNSLSNKNVAEICKTLSKTTTGKHYLYVNLCGKCEHFRQDCNIL